MSKLPHSTCEGKQALLVLTDSRLDSSHPLSSFPPDVFNLLWFKDGPFRNFSDKGPSREVDMEGFVVSISFGKVTSSEPSAIGMRLKVKQPSPDSTPSPLPWFPSYSEMTPVQRGHYLIWLHNVDAEIDIGYVFVFYYGLERHLFFGNFEAAFRMIMRLRKHHQHESFQSYSSTAIISACVFHNRFDLFFEFMNSLTSVGHMLIGDIYLLTKRVAGTGLVPAELMALAGRVRFENRRYLKGERELFEASVQDVLRERFNDDQFPLDIVLIDSCPVHPRKIAANYMLSDEQRTIQIPCMLQSHDFMREVSSILQAAHDKVKRSLKETRKSGAAPVAVSVSSNPAKKPHRLFGKSRIFAAINAHMFDRNVDCYNRAICPACGKGPIQRPSNHRKCSFCKATIYLKNSILTEQKVLFTEADTRVMDGLRKEKARRTWVTWAVTQGFLEEKDLSEALKRMTLEQAIEEHVRQTLAAPDAPSTAWSNAAAAYEAFEEYEQAIQCRMIHWYLQKRQTQADISFVKDTRLLKADWDGVRIRSCVKTLGLDRRGVGDLLEKAADEFNIELSDSIETILSALDAQVLQVK